MSYFQPVPIETYVTKIILDDREIFRITDGWNIERSEVAQILIQHFRSLGIYTVRPMRFAKTIRANIILQLRNNPDLLARLAQIAHDIEKVKIKHTRHAA